MYGYLLLTCHKIVTKLQIVGNKRSSGLAHDKARRETRFRSDSFFCGLRAKGEPKSSIL
jgi:hypothetical protein